MIMTCEAVKVIGNGVADVSCGEEMAEIWSFRTSRCESGCCEAYVRFFQCPVCKTVRVKE